MTQAVDLENLREMTGGDMTLEKELFDVFLVSADKCLQAMRESCGPEAQETWRTQAHAWKGMSLNLGAEKLGQLCAKAQMSASAGAEEKTALLAEIESAYAEVKAFLQTQM